MSLRTQYDPFPRQKASTELGKVSDAPLTYSVSQVTATNASATLLAAAASTVVTRTVTINTPSGSAVDAAGFAIYIDFGQAASSGDFGIPPGVPLTITTLQEIRVIRAGGSDVTTHLLVGVKSA